MNKKKQKMGSEELDLIRHLFTYYWKIILDYGLLEGSDKIAEDVRAIQHQYVSFPKQAAIAFFLVGKFYIGEPCKEEVWEYAKKYLLRQEQLTNS